MFECKQWVSVYRVGLFGIMCLGRGRLVHKGCAKALLVTRLLEGLLGIYFSDCWLLGRFNLH